MANRIVSVHAGIYGMGIYVIMLPSSGFSVAYWTLAFNVSFTKEAYSFRKYFEKNLQYNTMRLLYNVIHIHELNLYEKEEIHNLINNSFRAFVYIFT